MPYELAWEPSGVIFRYSGVVSNEDIIASNREVYASPLFPAMNFQIVDLSKAEKFDVSNATVRTVADLDREASETNPNVRIAVIVSVPIMRGMSIMLALIHEAVGGSWTTEFFEREEDARAWAISSS